jgi:ATP/maltotriose-dependent transcriptional regulator MalT
MARARADGRPTVERHQGHDVTTTAAGRLYCRTCHRGEHDVDEIAVERAVAGDPPDRLTTAEREAAVTQLVLMGVARDEIARRVNCDRSHIGRIKARLGLTKERR